MLLNSKGCRVKVGEEGGLTLKTKAVSDKPCLNIAELQSMGQEMESIIPIHSPFNY